MCITGKEDAVTDAGTFSWDRNERPVLEKCVWDVHVCVCVCVCVCVFQLHFSSNT